MTPVELLQGVHVRFEKNTDYPDSTEEDHVVRVAYMNDAIDTLEKEALEGVNWDFLKTSASMTFSGTGTDTLPSDFLTFLRVGNSASLKIGNATYTETSSSEGNMLANNGEKGAYVMWIEGTNLRTYPEASGTITVTYIKHATRYPLGTEVTTLEIPRPLFIQEYILANLYLDDGNVNQYNAHMNIAKDQLDTMRLNTLINRNEQNNFAFGL